MEPLSALTPLPGKNRGMSAAEAACHTSPPPVMEAALE